MKYLNKYKVMLKKNMDYYNKFILSIKMFKSNMYYKVKL